MIDFIGKEKCTGCEACASACPKGCITMLPDAEGFKLPQVNQQICIKCQKCIHVCPVINFDRNHDHVGYKKEAYAYKAKSEEYRAVCSSGGAFFALSCAFIEAGGVVYGAAFDKEFQLIHKPAYTDQELVDLAGSKYLQSEINHTYKEIKDKLTDGVSVLFFGMTCQVEGLCAFLEKEYDTLYSDDLICMGIPSPMVWEKYLKTYFRKSQIRKINFKDKRLGWHQFSFYLENIDGSSVVIPGFDHAYLECMFKGYSIRKSCFSCVYKCESKISDMTIADCWGCENYIAELDDNKGLSMVIAHSEKSSILLDILGKTGALRSIDYDNVLNYNSNYNQCTTFKRGRILFYYLLRRLPRLAFELMGKNPNKSIFRKIRNKIKRLGG